MSVYSYMTPLEHLEIYHNLRFKSPLTNAPLSAEVTGYGSGWGDGKSNRKKKKEKGDAYNPGQMCQMEYGRFNAALRVVVTGSASKPTRNVISFKAEDGKYVDEDEEFYDQSFRRALNGKGSPCEIIDLLRVAIIVGRIKIGQDAAGWKAGTFSLGTYMDAFLTLDCNGLSGNYYGIDPETSIGAYAVPARARRKIGDVRTGDALVTVMGTDHHHIALIHEFTPVPGSSAANGRICEWGGPGDFDHHSPRINQGNPQEIRQGPNRSYGLGWGTKEEFRYIFGPPKVPAPRAWGLGDNEGW